MVCQFPLERHIDKDSINHPISVVNGKSLRLAGFSVIVSGIRGMDFTLFSLSSKPSNVLRRLSFLLLNQHQPLQPFCFFSFVFFLQELCCNSNFFRFLIAITRKNPKQIKYRPLLAIHLILRSQNLDNTHNYMK